MADQRLQLGLGCYAREPVRARGDAKSVEGLQGHVFLD
jgi:hypothetical protein